MMIYIMASVLKQTNYYMMDMDKEKEMRVTMKKDST